MHFFICDNQIAGISEIPPQGLPANFQIVEGPNLPIELLYFDGEEILEKPEPPTPAHIWDNFNKEWVLPASPVIALPASSNWDLLLSSLHNSPEWDRAYTASERTLKANTAYTTLLTILATTRHIDGLQNILAKLREAMSAISGVGDFTPEEIASINGKLAAAGFDLQLS